VILYFLRHGRAVDAHDSDDAARPLSPEGVELLRGAGNVWRRLNLRPQVVLSSPLARAAQTASLLCETVGLGGEPLLDPRLRPGADWPALAQAMAEHPDARRVLFVGHQPDLGRVVELLTGASSVRLRPGSLACVEFPGVPEPGSGELAWLLDPDLYVDAGS
jgi:phosphohistidine phosphatase